MTERDSLRPVKHKHPAIFLHYSITQTHQGLAKQLVGFRLMLIVGLT
jgi:hypothetical protein